MLVVLKGNIFFYSEQWISNVKINIWNNIW